MCCSPRLLLLSHFTGVMQSQGSTSTQPSFDSLSSSDSLVLSDSEQTEDDTDVFLTDSSSSVTIGEVASKKELGSRSPRSQWVYGGFSGKEEAYRSQNDGKGTNFGMLDADVASQRPKSEGDLLFAQKCAELQGFVRPLLELLNGLKSGRFDHGLSSFQQSVAMDRIQRIVGVLQRPDCGEKYLNTLLQVEVMLKLWFPHISARPVSSSSSFSTSPTHSLQDTSSSTPPHKHRDQLHIPVKKRRLSWTDTDSPTPSPVPIKCRRTGGEERRKKHTQDERDQSALSPLLASDANPSLPYVVCSSQLNSGAKGNDSEGEELDERSKYKAAQNSEPRLTWVHVAPIPSPRKSCISHEAIKTEGVGEMVLAAGSRGSPAMQDCSISSTTPSKNPKNQKKPTQCQSQPVAAGQQGETESTGTCQGQNQPALVPLKPLARVCPSTVET
ncbi:PREDICTED: circadian-associated transcriptional repressor [Poecilia mexicana]|uniref:Circadian associated repressor of transcription a n=1 Tax=Poecilia mexicana TaxID=48701 RepID=A0A3B3XZN7_9TELE|nr:PREDICTED: circadian-associated transcriptional repressor [Poecilia mexicana]